MIACCFQLLYSASFPFWVNTRSELRQTFCLFCLSVLPLFSPTSPVVRDKELLPPPPPDHQNPLRPQSKPVSGKTAPRKEPRGGTGSNITATPPAAAVQQKTPAPLPAVTLNQVRVGGVGRGTCLNN